MLHSDKAEDGGIEFCRYVDYNSKDTALRLGQGGVVEVFKIGSQWWVSWESLGIYKKSFMMQHNAVLSIAIKLNV